MKKIDILDSTLRDGSQGEGISYSVQDKINIVKALDELGVAFIEAGNPGSNPKDMEFFQEAKKLSLKNSKIVAFGSTRRKDLKCSEDANLQSLLSAETEVVCIFGKTWDFQVTEILHATLEENLEMIRDTCDYLTKKGKTVIFDAEHFFTGFAANKDYAMKALSAAVEGGASCLSLCETKGGAMPMECYNATKAVVEKFCDSAKNVSIGIHTHNDSGLAVANSLLAVEAGDATPVDYSFFITNADCASSSFEGWTTDGSWGSNTTFYHNGDAILSNRFSEAWVGSGNTLGDRSITQTLTDLPAGKYQLSFDAIATVQSDASATVAGAVLFLGDQEVSCSTANGVPETFTTSDYTVSEGESVTLGFKLENTTANWVAFDNFRLRYLGGAVTLGDVNNDGTVSIADVTALVNIILGKGGTGNQAAADVNRDGTVTIADVTALVNIILGKNCPPTRVQTDRGRPPHG